MESKNESKKLDIKNRACHYFDDIISILLISKAKII